MSTAQHITLISGMLNRDQCRLGRPDFVSRPTIDILAGQHDRLYGPVAEQVRRQFRFKEHCTALQMSRKLVAIFGGYLGLVCKSEAGRRGGDVKRVNLEGFARSTSSNRRRLRFPLDFVVFIFHALTICDEILIM